LVESFPVILVVRLDMLTKFFYLSENTVDTFVFITLFRIGIGSQNVRSFGFFLNEMPVVTFGWILCTWSELVQELSLFVLFFANFDWVFNLFLLLGLTFDFFCLHLQIVVGTQLPFSFSVLVKGFLD
jgi:hypothetical protein